jgi:pyruvate/2-oxoglutarate dehydrogenase complex dihydrolipoamide acyltransferase (E2) component
LVTAVVMPQMGLEVTEGTVVEVLVSAGARVEKDDPLVVLSTDKADTDVVAPVSGIVREVGVEVGETVEVGATLLALEPLDAADAPDPAEPPDAPDSTGRVGAHARSAGTDDRTSDEPPRLRAAPVARRGCRTSVDQAPP